MELLIDTEKVQEPVKAYDGVVSYILPSEQNSDWLNICLEVRGQKGLQCHCTSPSIYAFATMLGLLVVCSFCFGCIAWRALSEVGA